MEKRLIEVACSGSYYDMGHSQGTWLRPRVDDMFARLVDNNLVPKFLKLAGPRVLKGLLTLKGHGVRKRHVPNIMTYSRSQMERLHGIADGARLPLELVLGLASIETMAASFQFVLGCTSLGLGKSRTKKGEPLL